MTTENGEWVTAKNALDILAPRILNRISLAEDAIMSRAGVGLVKARAERLIIGAAVADNADMSAELWQHELEAMSWATGDFKSKRRMLGDPWQAFGVSFLRTDIEDIARATTDTSASEEWVSALDALNILTPRMMNTAALAMGAIRSRAEAGMVKSRAFRLIVGTTVTDRADLPAELWRHPLSRQNWATGDFRSEPRSLHDPWQAFGVSFLRTDIERIAPPPAVAESDHPEPAAEIVGDFNIIPTEAYTRAPKKERVRRALHLAYPRGRVPKTTSTEEIRLYIVPILAKAGVRGSISADTIDRVLGRRS